MHSELVIKVLWYMTLASVAAVCCLQISAWANV